MIAASADCFGAGVSALRHLTDGLIHVCQTAGADLVEAKGQVRCTVFDAQRMGGASAQVERLHPVGAGRQVWVIGYVDVIALGRLLTTGRLDRSRVVSMAAPPSTEGTSSGRFPERACAS